jgi:hypothetical protein
MAVSKNYGWQRISHFLDYIIMTARDLQFLVTPENASDVITSPKLKKQCSAFSKIQTITKKHHISTMVMMCPRYYSYLSLLSFVLLRVGAFQPGPLPTTTTSWRIPVRSVAVAVPTRSKVLLRSHSLQTALEFLADERCMLFPAYKSIHWFDPTKSINHDADDDDDSGCMTLPLYPLSATYLPAMGVNHTLNNVQPRNIRMALDLAAASATAASTASISDARFCVALNTVDTGKIATVGVVMRVLDVQPQEVDGTVVRVTVTCCCEEIVCILRVENPEAARLENKIRRSDDYLMARVQPYDTSREDGVSDSIGSGEKEQLLCPPNNHMVAQKLVDDYNAVRSMYLDGTGKNDLPPFALATLTKDLPALPPESSSSSSSSLLSDTALFWQTAQMWQTLCYTVREGRQMRLSVDRNEIMIAAAMKKGGPLKLPVHMEDLGPADRRQLEEMEVEAQREWVELGLDPCLDFQVLLTLREAVDRIAFLARMVNRERLRLEQVARQPVAPVKETAEQEPRRKGAWFEDD